MDATILSSYVAYTAWASGRTLEALSPLTDEEFTRDLKIGFSSVRGTLFHMVGADWYHYGLLTGERPEAPAWFTTGGEGATLADFCGWYPTMQERWNALADKVNDPEQAAQFAQEMVEIHGAQLPKWQVAMNIVSHGTYHRGQLATLIRQLGHTPIDTDIIHYYFDIGGKRWPY